MNGRRSPLRTGIVNAHRGPPDTLSSGVNGVSLGFDAYRGTYVTLDFQGGKATVSERNVVLEEPSLDPFLPKQGTELSHVDPPMLNVDMAKDIIFDGIFYVPEIPPD